MLPRSPRDRDRAAGQDGHRALRARHRRLLPGDDGRRLSALRLLTRAGRRRHRAAVRRHARGADTNPTEAGALFAFTGWLTPGDIWSVDAAGKVAATGLTPTPPIDVSAYETHRAFATVRDGTKVPYTLIYRKGLKRDGRTPAWICAYGSYGLPAYTPAFAGKTLALVDAGFIVGYAAVRGGGSSAASGTRPASSRTSPTPGATSSTCARSCAKKYTARGRLAIGGWAAHRARGEEAFCRGDGQRLDDGRSTPGGDRCAGHASCVCGNQWGAVDRGCAGRGGDSLRPAAEHVSRGLPFTDRAWLAYHAFAAVRQRLPAALRLGAGGINLITAGLEDDIDACTALDSLPLVAEVDGRTLR